MKYIAMYLLIFTLTLVAPAPAHAQVSCVTVTKKNLPARAHAQMCGPVTQGTSLANRQDTLQVNPYIAGSYERRSKAWWNTLEHQLTLSLDVPYEQVEETALQNIIFFATHHGEKVKLNDAAARLLGIYRNHDQVTYRIMALAALHAIGDESAMQQLNQIVEDEASNRVRHVAIAALHDHYYRK